MGTRLNELSLGLRFGVTGGASARLRALLTAVGVGIGVAALLLAASVPRLVDAHDHRESALTHVYGRGQLRLMDTSTSFHGAPIEGITVQPTGSHPAVPPGVTTLPGPGEMVVSPALRSLLDSPDGAELRRRLGARVIGTISNAGLVSPTDARFVRGSDNLAALGPGDAIEHFGTPVGPTHLSPLITLLIIVILVALLLPIAIFISTAARFGGEERDRRLAALRLLGADVSGTSLIAAGESLLGGIGGLGLGTGIFLAVRPLIAHVTVEGVGLFESEIWPSPALAGLTAGLVLGCVIGASLLGMRSVAIEPLGVSHRGRPRHRRLAWRLTAPVLGLLALAPFALHHTEVSSAANQIEAAAGIVLVLIGITALLPWAVERIVRSSGAGPLPWLLAVRRLRADEGTTGRVVAAIGLAVAGAIALQMLFSAAQSQADQHGLTVAQRATDYLAMPTPDANRRSAIERLRALPGVVTVINVQQTGAYTNAEVRTRSDAPAELEALRDGLATIDPLAQINPLSDEDEAQHTLTDLRRALLAGALAVLAMMGTSLLVTSAEQLRERRRVLAVLAAFGTRRSTVAWSLLWQAAIPVTAGLALATALGSLLGVVLMRMVRVPAAIDWGSVGLLVAAGAAVIATITTVTLPLLWRLMTPDALRAE